MSRDDFDAVCLCRRAASGEISRLNIDCPVAAHRNSAARLRAVRLANKVEPDMKNLIERRPTEVASGVGLFAATYAALTGAGVNEAVAVAVAAIVAFLPGLVTAIVDAVRSRPPQ